VVSFFVKGPGADTLPVVIYSMIKKSREFPVINALSTLLLIVTFAAVWTAQRLGSPRTQRPTSVRQMGRAS
jgi:spermidine/putrescine transport system permease protein